MRTQIHPGVFLASAIALSAAWLWLRPAPPAPPAPTPPSPAGATQRPAAATRPSIRVDDAILRRYAGRYGVEGIVVTVSVDGERLLVGVVGDPRPAALRAASETKFFFDAFPGEITFEAGDPAKGFVADLGNGRYRATRVGD